MAATSAWTSLSFSENIGPLFATLRIEFSTASSSVAFSSSIGAARTQAILPWPQVEFLVTSITKSIKLSSIDRLGVGRHPCKTKDSSCWGSSFSELPAFIDEFDRWFSSELAMSTSSSWHRLELLVAWARLSTGGRCLSHLIITTVCTDVKTSHRVAVERVISWSTSTSSR